MKNVGPNCQSIGQYFLGKELGWFSHSSLRFQYLERPDQAIYQKDVKGHFGCVNAIETSLDENYLISGGDDRRVLLWRISDIHLSENPTPLAVMNEKHYSNIFTVKFSLKSDRLYSGGNDSNLFVHDVETTYAIYRFANSEAIYDISIHPRDEYTIMSASEDGRVRFYDLRVGRQTVAIANIGTVYCAQFNPRHINLISVCNAQRGLTLYDLRKLESPDIMSENRGSAYMNICKTSVMYGEWSEDGDAIFINRSGSSPLLYDLNGGATVEFRDQNYKNSCTVKSCSFISRDLVMTGSDDWKIYIWKVPSDRETVGQKVNGAYRTLEGHRSIVNHMRYSPSNRLLFSSGVEKIIKLQVWSELNSNGFYDQPKKRCLGPVNAEQDIIVENSVEEDSHMLTFFDLLTTREAHRSSSIGNTSENNSNDEEIVDGVRIREDFMSHNEDYIHSLEEDSNRQGSGFQTVATRLISAHLEDAVDLDDENFVFIVSSPESPESPESVARNAYSVNIRYDDFSDVEEFDDTSSEEERNGRIR
ncbi:unnamed protein product [Thelazia callipaeda]|uniref:WD_REPEATS_REGION domain-containing protein n=1 Tax=Thelazia callipaeda TaxID=103827 RepID=A0A0N5D758_THECL|nr:unnamed protein product [Thelazia callipaeda]